MDAAWFGLLGVVVGGLITTVAAFIAAIRQEVGDGVVSARLVNDDLRLRDEALKDARRVDPPGLDQQQWRANRMALARVLALGEWEAVAACYRVPADQGDEFGRISQARQSLKPFVRNKRSVIMKRLTKVLLGRSGA